RLDAVPYLCVREGTNNENLPETHDVLKRMRAALDQTYRNRMLLAEANQWPADVRPYFGEGDECHMAFHFPLMPRMFMALRQEDRHAITEILSQTPDIPDSSQWALFLRNHDELTLEMVTDEERDYMYQVYGYQAINVEAQERYPFSLLNWMKRLIATRKQHRVFGRGSVEIVGCPNRKLLAYLRRDDHESILVVSNLSRSVQPAELDLKPFAGLVPIEMNGMTEFP